jgi:hypothetical protein
MEIKLIKATVRYSQDTGKGAWKEAQVSIHKSSGKTGAMAFG